MELKATAVGQHLARHPYNKAKLLNAGVEVSGERHGYIIPFTQLLAINCKRGLVWGELEFGLADGKVIRLHGLEWYEAQQFYQYLVQKWHAWSLEMATLAASMLKTLADKLTALDAQDAWLTGRNLLEIKHQIENMLASLPLLTARLAEFAACKASYDICLSWLADGDELIKQHNQRWSKEKFLQYSDFFDHIESQPLNLAQRQAVVTGVNSALVLAGAGSGKTALLIARAGWLLLRSEATAEQILLLSFDCKAAEEMNQRLKRYLPAAPIEARTFHALALQIVNSSGRKTVKISRLESDAKLRHKVLIERWQTLCKEKKNYANGWRTWLFDELEWPRIEGDFWQDPCLIKRLVSKLEYWLALVRSHDGSQAEMIAGASAAERDLFQKRLRLLTPLVKAWKIALKEEGAVDFSAIIAQATQLLNKNKFNSPWTHILIDEFQDISPQRAAFIQALNQQNQCKQNKHRCALFAVGDDWQAIYRFSGAELTLTTAFKQVFADGVIYPLDTTYRFNQGISDIASAFIQQDPNQLKKSLNSLIKGDKSPVVILPEQQLEKLLDKMSGYVQADQKILLLARYAHLCPDIMQRAATRWPHLTLEFMTIHASKGLEADYVIVVGLQAGIDAFPAQARESVIERVLLPQPDDFEDAEERRLLYVALTRAKLRLWLLYDGDKSSTFVQQLHRLGVPIQRKP